MNLQATKLELIKMIADLESEQLLQTIFKLIQQENSNTETAKKVELEKVDNIKVSDVKTEAFWTWIEKIDSTQPKHEERLKPLIDRLATAPISAIQEFSEQLAFHLHQLDGPTYFDALKNRKQGVSADTFLYTRCLVIAKGKAFYHSVLTHPEKMPIDDDLEALLYVDEQAYEQKTGKKYDYVPSINYESFFNKNLWQERAISL